MTSKGASTSMGKRLTLNVEPNNNRPLPQVHSSSSHNNHQSTNNGSNNRQQRTNKTSNLIYGWRLQCLYFVIFLLMLLISINLALTLWILKVMEVSSDGIGQLKVVEGGIQLEGQAIFLDELRTSHFRSKHGHPITFESSKNITFNTRDSDGHPENQLFLGHDRFDVQTKLFRVADMHGNTLFKVDRNSVEIAAKSLDVQGEGGVTFENSILTSKLEAEPGKQLKLVSPTRSLKLDGSQGIDIISNAGSIEAKSFGDIVLSAKKNIRLDAETIIISNLKTTQPNYESKNNKDHQSTNNKIYQVCVCENGKLFLAHSSSYCGLSTRDGEDSICR